MQLLGKIFFWYSMRWLKDLCPGMVSVMSTCTADLRRNSVSGLNLLSASQTSLQNVSAVITHLPLGTKFQCRGTAVLVAELPLFSQLWAQGPVMITLELVHLLLVASAYCIQF